MVDSKGVIEVKNVVMSHFEGFFKEGSMRKPVPDGLEFKSLYEEENLSLEEPFSKGDIKEAA